MSEVLPQITYTPAGILTIARSDIEIAEYIQASRWGNMINAQYLEDRRERAAEFIGGLPGVEISDGEIPEIAVPIREALEEPLADPKKRDELEGFLDAISLLTLLKEGEDSQDQVLTFSELNSHRVTAIVNRHFQGWLNNTDIIEEVAKDCIVAMATPYKREEDAEANFSYRQFGDTAIGRSGGLEVAVRTGQFTIEKYFNRRGTTRKSDGHANWKWLSMDTLGDANMGLSFDSRQRVRHGGEDKKLYRMFSYNIDNARQSLGLLLGLGSLAHYAAQDLNTYNLFKDVKWDRSRAWPFPVPDLH